jgi:hypothetical protein
VSKQNRLDKLEAAIGRAALDNIPDADVELYCNACLGPLAYRRRVDAARARLYAMGWNPDGPGPRWPQGEPEWPSAAELVAKAEAFVCRGCGAAKTIAGAIDRVRKEIGAE